MTHIDAILHIADLPALAAAIAKIDPGAVSEDGIITGFASTPATMNGSAALVYVRMTLDEAAQWRGTPGVTILAEAAYAGRETPDQVYAQVFADEAAAALYRAVYDPQPITLEDGTVYQEPERFGALA